MDEKVLQPWQLLVLGMAGIINADHQHIVEYLQTENKILKESFPDQPYRLLI